MNDRAWKLEWLYLVSAALLATHEIDSAYWHEWRLFGLPVSPTILALLVPLSVTQAYPAVSELRELPRGG